MSNLQLTKELAFDYGVNAHKRGTAAAPALDKKFMNDFFTGVQVGNSNTLKFMEEWSKGWHTENVKKNEKSV